MQDKPQILRHFSGLRDSGHLMNLDQDTDVVDSKDDSSKKGDDIVGWLGSKEKSRVKYLSTYDDGTKEIIGEKGVRGNKKEKDDTISNEYYEIMNEKYSKVTPGVEKFWGDVFGNKKTTKDDIINSLPMSEGMDKTNQQPEKGTLSPEDLKLQEAVYSLSKEVEGELRKIYPNRAINERHSKDLGEFMSGPYKWMRMKLLNNIKEDGEKLDNADKKEKLILIKEIERDKLKLNTLLHAFERDIPLKLNTKYTAEYVELGGENLFNVKQCKEELNGYFGKNNKYEIKGVIQRGWADLIVLKTDSGEVELDIKIADRLFKEKKEQRENRFNAIKDGDIIKVNTDGIDAQATIFKVLKKNSEEISLENRTKNNQITLLRLDNFKDFLFNQKSDFSIEDEEEDIIPLPPAKQEEMLKEVKGVEILKVVESVRENKEEKINEIIKEMLELKESGAVESTEREEEINKDKQIIKDKEERLEKLLEISSSPTTIEEVEVKDDDLPVPTPPEQITTEEENKVKIKNEIERIKEEIRKEQEEFSKKGILSFGRRKLKKSIEASQALLKQIITEDINLDIKEKPFMYFAAQKIKNTEVLKRFINKITKSLDLRWAETPTSYECTTKLEDGLQMIGKNEGFFEFNIYGFMKVVKNVNQFEGSIYSEEAIYKILNPDGKIIADDIKGYQAANDIYMKETEKYEKLVEEEFNKPNNI